MSDDTPRILSKQECQDIVRRAFGFASGGETHVTIHSWWNGELRWARNRVSLASDRRDITLGVDRYVDGAWGGVTTNQTDDVSLEAAVRAAERGARHTQSSRRPAYVPPVPELARPKPAILSQATSGLTAEARGEVARTLIGPAEAKGLLSAGYLEVRAGARMSTDSRRPEANAPWDTPYGAWTHAQCSLTVRDPEGTGSGWAGRSSYDWAKLDPPALAARALEKCLASQHPVALEPGRYTVILEPQAVADLMEMVVRSLDRQFAESGRGPWVLGSDDALGLVRTKLGLKVVDERITISHDPADPELGILPDAGMGPVTWVDHGVLTSLVYDRTYALEKLNANVPLRWPIGYRMSGGDTSIEEMIRTTRRGLLVTRFSNIDQLDGSSLLGTGLTRDGLWLVENGTISKAVKNLRFTESPLFVLNSLEQLGPPAPVFRPVRSPYDAAGLTPAIVPPLKARDFSFTSTIDAI
jgi:predicted Zn-dependent protease